MYSQLARFDTSSSCIFIYLMWNTVVHNGRLGVSELTPAALFCWSMYTEAKKPVITAKGER